MKNFARRIKTFPFEDVLMLGGCAAVTWGAGMIHEPTGYIVGGGLLCGLAFLVGIGRKKGG